MRCSVYISSSADADGDPSNVLSHRQQVRISCDMGSDLIGWELVSGGADDGEENDETELEDDA